MSEKMRPISFENLLDWCLDEYKQYGSVFGVRKEKFYKNQSKTSVELFGDKLSSIVGPAAGPNSQLAQNIIASYLAGSRFVEVKTVQTLDGEDLGKCVPRPCINATDECYNQEWSTELYVPEALDEYIKAYMLIHVLAKEFELADEKDFAFNMSVGYDLEGIMSQKIDTYIEGMKDASKTEIWGKYKKFLSDNLHRFKRFTKDDLDNMSTCIASGITLSTLHGCPPDEIERIAKYLLDKKKTHTFIKCNPTLLGYEFARKLMDDMGYSYIVFDDHHFKNDLQFGDAVAMFNRLIPFAKERGLAFGLKLTNTFPVQKKNGELPGDEMYMSGRSLYPLSISLANKISQEFKGRLPISFSGGADAFNVKEIYEAGIFPITVATTILKPGGYERLKQMALKVEPILSGKFHGIDVAGVEKLAREVREHKDNVKAARPVGNRKTKSELPLFDCAKAPCKDGGCPIEQQIPEYLQMVGEKNYERAFKIIATDNSSPAVLSMLCDHQCQHKCTRLDYDSSLEIRNAKRLAVINAMDTFNNKTEHANILTKKRVAVIGAGPGGCSVGLFLRRNGMEVDVFEKRQTPYGIVAHVIPEFRIPMGMIERDFAMAKNAGVNFHFGCDENYDLEKLKQDYDFVVLATGAWLEPKAPCKEGADKLWGALDFLEQSKKSNLSLKLGKRVAVLGGGSVAMDCARSALRTPDVQEACVVYRRTADFMPAEPEEKDLALEEGVKFLELVSPASYNENILKCEVMELGERDSSGRLSIKSTGEFVEYEFDTVINATGARVDTSKFAQNGLELNEWGYAKINSHNETSKENVYICGDCKSGASTIVRAIADAKKIAKDILNKCGLVHDFVKHQTFSTEKSLYEKKGILTRASKSGCDTNRCLACDKVCELCVDVCPNRANVLVKVESGTKEFADSHQILHVDGMCNECGNCGIFCPHSGRPYKDKVTVFWTEEDFVDSTNVGFLKVSDTSYRIRTKEQEIIEYTLGEDGIDEGLKEMIVATNKHYDFYMNEERV